MKLSIIVVSYNTKELTLQTLTSIDESLKQSKGLLTETEVIVVDNASKDGSQEAVQQFSHSVHFPVVLIKNTENVGFAKANNTGITRARGDYYLLLNSDTIILKNALETLVNVFEAHEIDSTTAHTTHSDKTDNIGILTPSLFYADKQYQPQGGNFPSLATLFFHMSFVDDIPYIGVFFPSTQHTGKRQLRPKSKALIRKDWVGGTAMMIRKEVVSEIGVLDESIFMYGEDIEFCMRAHNHSWDIVEVPSAHVIHIQSASGSSENAIRGELKGYLHIWAKHKPAWQIPIARAIITMGVALRSVIFGTIVKNKQKATLYANLVKEIESW